MPSSTTNLGLYKYDTATDGDLTFNFKDSLNDNWDKVDTAYKGLSDDKADTATVNSALALKADTLTVNTALALKADKTQLHALKGYSDNGELLTDAEGLADVTNYAHSSFDRSKFTVVGSPTITDDGIASGFGNNNGINKTLTVTPAHSLRLRQKFTLGSDTSTRQTTFGLKRSGSDRFVLELRFIGDNAKYSYLLYSTGADSHAEIRWTATELPKIAGDTYDVDITINGTELVASINGVTKTINDFYYSTTELVRIGAGTNGNNDYPLLGTADLKQFSITVDGVEVFSGNKTGIDTIKPDDYTVVGTPTISADGVMQSPITSSNYITTGFSYDISKDFEYSFSAYITYQSGLGDQYLCGLRTNNSRATLRFNGTKIYCVFAGSDGVMNLNYTQSGWYDFIISKKGTDFILKSKLSSDITYTTNTTTLTGTYTSSNEELRIGYVSSNYMDYAKIDLNTFKFYNVDGNLVYQPCLKIPYTKGSEQYGGKYVNAQYLPRVKDAYEQGLANDYFTLDEVNGTYTLPMGNLYGMIEKLNQLAKDEIGLPKATLSNTLNDNEIWLEGAEVSKLTYSKLYAIYGDDYGIPSDSANFVLPDFRDRVMQGIGSGGTFGYISAGLPDITGKAEIGGGNASYPICISSTSGAFGTGKTGTVMQRSETSGGKNYELTLNASNSNSVYGNSTTVQPPAIKVRFKTRFQ